MKQPDEIKIILWGLGAMGSGIARALLGREGVRIVSAIRRDPTKAGVDLGDALGLGLRTGARVFADANSALDSYEADLVMHSTGSFTREVIPQIRMAVERGLDVITIAEEMAYPWASAADLAEELDEYATQQGASVLGTGINPGFVLDSLILALTATCVRVESIKAVRINDLSHFGPTVMRTQGVGTTLDEFRRGVQEGWIVGHIGFLESMNLVARSLGWVLDEARQDREPIITRTNRATMYVNVEPGKVAGCRHTASGFMKGKEVIRLEHPQQVRPEVEGVQTGDYIEITGEPDISLAIRPEIPGGIGTIAMAVNMIPAVLMAPPGILTIADLPIPRAWLCDLRDLVAGGRDESWIR